MVKKAIKKIKKAISLKSSIREVLSVHPETASVFLKYGLHCAGCPMAEPETLGDISKAHRIDTDKLINDLNKAVK